MVSAVAAVLAGVRPGEALALGSAVALIPVVRWGATLPPRPGQPDLVARQWARGADGERRTARRLRSLERRGWVVLHDRRIPASQANIDHLVIGPNGVQVVDTKVWRGPLGWNDAGELCCAGRPVDVVTSAWEALRSEQILGPG